MSENKKHMTDNAFANLNDWSAMEATGPDSGKFLQAFCTNDVLKLTDGQSCEAMFTDVKAHVVAYGWVMRVDAQKYRVLLGSSRIDELISHLDRYLIREKVELSQAEGDGVLIGRQLGSVLARDQLFDVPAFGPDCQAWLGSQLDRTAELQPLFAADRVLLEHDAFESIRIHQGVPLDGIDVDQRNLPQEVDRNERAISFTKGCYLGQEPVARIDSLGRVNWLLRGLVIEDVVPAPGAELISQEKVVGRVTSVVKTDRGATAMGYVRRTHADEGTELAIEESNATVHLFPIE